MDERTFQQELHQLKRQVENMALKHSPRASPPQMATLPPPQQASADVFHARLEDIKRHLSNLDHKVHSASASHVTLPQSSPSPQGPPLQQESIFSPHNHLALPSEPWEWQGWLSSLRNDMYSLGEHVATLEDRLDAFASPQFTPGSSVVTAADASSGKPDATEPQLQQAWSSPKPWGCSMPQDNGLCNARFESDDLPRWHQENHLRCSYVNPDGRLCNLFLENADERMVHGHRHMAAGHIYYFEPPTGTNTRDTNEDKISVSLPGLGAQIHQTTPMQPSPPSDEAIQPANHDNTKIAQSLLRTKLDAAQVSVDILRKYNERMGDGVASLDKHDAKLVTSIMKLHSRLSLDHQWNAPQLQVEDGPLDYPKDSLAGHGCGPAEELVTGASTAFMSARELDCPDETDRRASMTFAAPEPSVTMETTSPVPDPADARQRPSTPEGVAFRDMEIARMDELLRQANEDSKRSEDRAWTAEQRVAQQDDDINNLREAIAQREEDQQHLNEYLRTRGEQRDRLLEHFRETSERSQEKTAIICAAGRKIDELQRVLQDCQNGKDEEIEQMMQGREDEIRRLQEFCEQKDVIARAQEDVIARGARLMERKDEEIGQLSRRLKAAGDDVDHEGRQRDRVTKLLQERDGEIAELKGRLAASTAFGPPEIERPSEDAPARLAERQDRHEDDHFHRAASNDARGTSDNPSPFDGRQQERSRPPNGTWSPRPILGDRQSAEEARRASLWEFGPEASRPVFGRPSPIGYRRHHGPVPRAAPRTIRYQDDTGVVHVAPQNDPTLIDGLQQQHQQREQQPQQQSQRGQQRSRKCDGSPMSRPNTHAREMEEVRRPASGSFAAPPPSTQQSTFSNQRRQPIMAQDRRSLPMDRTFWPPLPAPVAASSNNLRMQPQSMADMRSAADRKHQNHFQRERAAENEDRQGGPRGSVMKHPRHVHSMQDLKRQRRSHLHHQAYVETEAESGGEMGGDV